MNLDLDYIDSPINIKFPTNPYKGKRTWIPIHFFSFFNCTKIVSGCPKVTKYVVGLFGNVQIACSPSIQHVPEAVNIEPFKRS